MIPAGSYVVLALGAGVVLAWVMTRIWVLTLRDRTEQATRLARTAIAAWAIGLLLATLRGSPPMDADSGPAFVLVPFSSHNTALDYEIVLNIFLFMPLALLLPWATDWSPSRTIRASITLACASSILIELAQGLTSLGIAGDITDVLLNTLGCLAASVPAATAYRFNLRRQAEAPAAARRGLLKR